MERPHGQLGAWLTDGLCSNDADSLSRAHGILRSQVHAVALGAHAAVSLAGEHCPDHDGGVLVNRGIEGTCVLGPGVLLDPLAALQNLGVSGGHHLRVGD